MTIEYFEGSNGENADSGEGSPYYTLDLPDLKKGDRVAFEAVDQWGKIIYAPEPAVFPSPIELLKPEEGQLVTAGDQVIIRWTGGEAEGVVYGAGYESLDGESRYFTNTAQSQELTVPAGQTQQGSAVFGAGATTGETQLLSLTSDELMQTSYFLVSTATAVNLIITGRLSTITEPMITERIPKPPVPAGCPNNGYHNHPRAVAHCVAELVTTLGIAGHIWANRKNYDIRHGCSFPKFYSWLNYCVGWRDRFEPMAWVGCCECDRPACPG